MASQIIEVLAHHNVVCDFHERITEHMIPWDDPPSRLLVVGQLSYDESGRVTRIYVMEIQGMAYSPTSIEDICDAAEHGHDLEKPHGFSIH